ncbi:MAG TPA: hypothetical protein ENK18_23015 [Deltaproteobacteria bacterium]|nr:hypothetical protein [Deltaproteobacteria bacterium]
MRIAVIGGGPVGLEAATEAIARGHEAIVYEAERIAAHVRRWGHVTLFTPWSMAVTERGLARIGASLPDPEGYPTGAQLVASYLEPLAATLVVREHTRVLQIGRTRVLKGQALGSSSRAKEPFRLIVETPDGTDVEHADAVFDCTGVFGDPAPAGTGGLAAPGEEAAMRAGRLRLGLARVDDLAGARVMLVGAGASAVTLLSDLLGLEPPPEITWVTLQDEVPSFVSPEDDVLPARRALYELGRSAPDHPCVTHHPNAGIDRMFTSPTGTRVTLTDQSSIEVDQVIAATGFRPDHRLSRELQFHVCWGSEGPMRLAAALLASSGDGGDCLDQPTQGAETLLSPEPRFFVLGNKSYGRRSDFLLKIGHAQVRDALDLLGDP